MTRTRSRVTEPEHGGDPCPEQTQTQTCNSFACNTPCVLQDWSSWGLCPKMCGGGHAERKRDVLVEARGLGYCDAVDSPARLDYEVCNNFPCSLLLPPGREVLHCTAMIDVILVIDGSGSLRQYGWDQSKAMAEKLVSSMQGGTNGVNLGVLLFSGPEDWSNYKACKGEDGSQPSAEVCGVRWVTHLNSNMVSTLEDVKALEWPKRTTLTSLALLEAKDELKQGRPEASSVVVVITDGKPMSPLKTGFAAMEVKDSARLVFVPVGQKIKKIMPNLKEWASQPWQDNILEIDTFSILNAPATMNGLISEFCPQVN